MGKRKQNSSSNGVHSLSNIDNNRNDIGLEDDVATHADSPLKLFGEAKGVINGLFVKLDSSVTKASEFYCENQIDSTILQHIDTNRLKRLKKSIETIRQVLSRNQMKVAFFGRTSNGKSTVINAILHNRVLPMGFGHTTGCFLQIQGNQTDEAYYQIETDNQDGEKRPLQSMAHIANALNHDALDSSSLIKIFWPISKCPLLRYDVALVDSPGVDVEGDLDEWIDAHCHDADVFVLVSNAESTLNLAEKNFFFKVKEKLSKPNIFILNNRWDSIADEPDAEMEKVRAQHTERAVSFLSDELKISSRDEAKRRTFFVSARETLASRSPNESRANESMREGFASRSQEFSDFERCFEESLSKSAVKTKFQKHNDKGIETVKELNSVLIETKSLVSDVSRDREDELKKLQDRYRRINAEFHAKVDNIREGISFIKREIQIKTDEELEHEISRLSRIVEDFEQKFSPHYHDLISYKENLYVHVENSLSENLQSRINGLINKNITPFKVLLTDLSGLLPDDAQKEVQQIIASEAYVQDELFDLSTYKKFFTDFQEDLEFRFSLGLITIMRKFQSKFGKHEPINANSSMNHSANLSSSTDMVSMIERFILISPQSPTTVGSLAVGGILVRTVGWKIIIMTSVIYGALYAYEFLTWTNSAKERTFKSQYTRYARKGLLNSAPIISQHIANSVGQKMLNVFSKYSNEMAIETAKIESKMGFLRSSLEKLRVCDTFTAELLGQNDVLLTELVAFANSFLN